ncbi:GM20551 [Drosophila sechellia]|uniref:GM20551 n=1 Tax=Drosophila sechellia TaxID=7238 RepID=B4HMC8_DROSE|nr:GM20551 [Drosophila sechellia]
MASRLRQHHKGSARHCQPVATVPTSVLSQGGTKSVASLWSFHALYRTREDRRHPKLAERHSSSRKGERGRRGEKAFSCRRASFGKTLNKILTNS